MQALVIPFGQSFDAIGFSYLVPENLEQDILCGQIVEVPLGEQKKYGVIYKIENSSLTTQGQQKKELKYIEQIISPESLIRSYNLQILPWIAEHYFTPIHNSLSLFLPKNLIEKAIKQKLDITKTREYQYQFSTTSLSPAQQDIYEHIKQTDKKNILLYGVTGSGKTEIYIKLIEDELRKNKQVLFLIPEIILTNQLANRLKKVFGNDIIVLNSSVTPAQKTKYLIDIYQNKAKIIIGTRSALFSPFADLGLIIIDEEHDQSYISDQAPRYHAREVAEKITEINKNKLLLASGTPSIQSMYKAVKGEYELLNLTEKFVKYKK